MLKFWIIAIFIFVASTYLLYKFTLEENRKETGEKITAEFGCQAEKPF